VSNLRPRLKSFAEWRDYCASGKKPADIPANASRVYAKAGWVGWGNWLGTGRVPNRGRKFRHFVNARAFVRKLGLKSGNEWRDYCSSGERLPDIPSNPDAVYRRDGWLSWADWLGTRRHRGEGWQPFTKARAFARRSGVKSSTEWRDYCKSAKRPADIPANPDTAYAKLGWISWGDWLGTGTVYRGDWRDQLGRLAGTGKHHGGWRPFRNARAFARRRGLKSENEWRKYNKSGRRPSDIPANPDRVYAKLGWISWGDWLGNERNTQARERSQMVPRIQGRRFSPPDQRAGTAISG
jgi:hypothetical protein